MLVTRGPGNGQKNYSNQREVPDEEKDEFFTILILLWNFLYANCLNSLNCPNCLNCL